MTAPLADVVVLAVEHFGAGPWATQQLRDLGATVVKLEDPGRGGDVSRRLPPGPEGEHSLYFETFNGGKRSIALDLSTDAGREVLLRLASVADAVFSNLRGSVQHRLGLAYEDLAPTNPKIVCCSLTGYGRDGDRSDERAYDPVIQAGAGWMALTGDPDGPPMRTGISLADYAAGYAAALALVAGVHQARRDGVGGDCDISLDGVAFSLLTYLGTWSASGVRQPTRHRASAHESLVPFQNFECTDGLVAVACATEDLWRRLCGVLGRADLERDERFATFAGRDVHREELLAALETIFRERPSREWEDRLRAGGVPCSRVLDVAEALAERPDRIVEYEHEVLGAVRRMASPFHLPGAPADPAPGPSLGADHDLLQTLAGLRPSEIEELRRRGAFGRPPD